jgi:hypothetical protein
LFTVATPVNRSPPPVPSIRLPIDPVEFSSALWAKLFTERPAELGRSEVVFAKLPLVEAHRILDTAAAPYTVATLRPAK